MVQPVLFAVMVSLAQVLNSYGITPDALIGHSQGEIAAAYLAGVLTLDEAAKVVALRSQALADLAGSGAMASVLLCAQELGPRLDPYGAALSIAAVNGPSHTVISGDPIAMGQFITGCERDGVQVWPIAVDCASHSHQVEALHDRLLEELAGLSPQPARVPLYATTASAASDQPLDTTTMDANYWYRNLREPVRFFDGVAGLLAGAECVFVELSSHPVLAPAISDALAVAGRAQSAVIGTLHRYQPDLDGLATAIARLHVRGHSPSWRGLYPHAGVVSLPTYAFQRRRFWLTPAAAQVGAGGLGLTSAQHPLLGAVTDLADRDEVVFSGRLSLAMQAWLGGHQVYNTVVLPATGFVDAVLHAAECAGCTVIDELVLHTPLLLAEHSPTDLQISVHPGDHGKRAFTVHARTSGAWTLHASGVLSIETPLTPARLAGMLAVDPIDTDSFYDQLAARGLGYSGLFRGVSAMGHDPIRPAVVCAEVALPAGVEVTGYGIHPALLDAALHPLAAALIDDATQTDGAARLPFALSGVRLYATAATRLQVRLDRLGTDSFRLEATDPAGAPVLTIDTITLRSLAALPSAGTPAGPAGPGQDVWELAWSAQPPGSQPATAATAATVSEWAVVTKDPGWLPGELRDTPIYPGLGHPDLAHTPMVIWALPPTRDQGIDPVGWVHALTAQVLTGLQGWLARPETSEIPLVALTRHAVATSTYDRAPDLAHAAVSALLHTAANEHPGRIRVLDTDNTAETSNELVEVLASLTGPTHELFEPQLALRHGVVYAPRLARAHTLTPPSSSSWRLTSTGNGDLSNLVLVATEPVTELGPGQIRVEIRAAGLNFRDVVVALGAISDQGLGAEAAGVVIETAADVSSVRPGDAVMGLFPNNAFAPSAITNADMVVTIPPGWSFPQAASVPVAFLTAYIGLVEVGGLSAGQTVLIHAGAGGVGQHRYPPPVTA